MLTSHERVARVFARRDHDRVPRFDQIWPETLERWRAEGMNGDPATVFDWDIVWVGWVAPAPFPGRSEVLREDAETRDTINEWGAKVRVWKNRSGTPEHLGWACTDVKTWREAFRPKLSSERWTADLKAWRQTFDAARAARKWTVLCGIQSYEAIKAMLGDEAMMLAFASEPEWIQDMSRRYTDVLLEVYERIFHYGIRPDAIWMFEDLAYSHGPLCSPQMYRHLVWPDHKRVCDFAHAHGMKFIFHTDGDINSYMDLFLEAGFDCLQPLEAKARVDIRQLAPRYGKKIAFFGNIDMMVAITNDKQKVEEEVRSKLAAGMATKGYLYHSDHSVPPQVSWETYRWLMECVEKYGRYA